MGDEIENKLLSFFSLAAEAETEVAIEEMEDLHCLSSPVQV